MSWAAELDADGVVLRVIVGDADWATANLGGRWVPAKKYDATETYPGPGYGYAANDHRKFAPVAPPGLEKAIDPDDPEALPPTSVWWDGGTIATIEVIAGRRGVLTPVEVAEQKPVKPDRRP